MTAYRDGTDRLFGYAPPLCAALILKPLANLQHAQLPFSGLIGVPLGNQPVYCPT